MVKNNKIDFNKIHCTDKENQKLNTIDKGYLEFLKEAKEKQMNYEASSFNKALLDNSDYNAIFMTF
jgi:hypothetical protein